MKGLGEEVAHIIKVTIGSHLLVMAEFDFRDRGGNLIHEGVFKPLERLAFRSDSDHVSARVDDDGTVILICDDGEDLHRRFLYTTRVGQAALNEKKPSHNGESLEVPSEDGGG